MGVHYTYWSVPWLLSLKKTFLEYFPKKYIGIYLI